MYYSSCSAPSKASYLKLECLLRDFLWASGSYHHGFHRVAWDYCCLPKESGGLGLLSTQKQGLALCAKWIIHAISRDEAWKILVFHCISSGFPVNKPMWKGIGFQTLRIMREPVVIQGSFVIKSIWKAWEAIKPWLHWAGDEFWNGLSLN